MFNRNYKFSVPIILMFAGLVFLSITLLGYSNDRDSLLSMPRQPIDLTEPDYDVSEQRPPTSSQDGLIRVAIAPVISPEKSLEIYSDFVDYLGEKLGRESEFLQRRSYAEVNDLVRFNQCDLALVCTYAYIRGSREFGMELLVIPRIDDEIHYHSYIIVPESSEATSLIDLKGMKFASADLMSTSGWLWPLTWLTDNGENHENFFSEHMISGSHDNSIFAVASGLVEGAAVDSLVYIQMINDDPELENKIKVIDESPAFGMPPLVIPGPLNPSLKMEILDILLDMHNDEVGRIILDDLNFDQFEVVSEELYSSVFEIVENWEDRND